MIKKYFLLLLTLSCLLINQTAFATDLIKIYQEALSCDPTYQQAVAQRLVDKQGVPINLALLLPSLTLQDTPSVMRSQFAGAQIEPIPGTVGALQPSNDTTRMNVYQLTLTQTVFNFAQISALAGARALSKQADATLNAATQDLITRVAKVYFAILQDEDNLIYTQAAKHFYNQQYDQVNQQYKVGLKTITDVYTAQASYENAVASYIQAANQLANDKENLRAITGRYYPSIAKLSDHFPLVTPHPQDIDAWTEISLRQNWSIKASQFAADSAMQNIHQQLANGNFPTINFQGIYNNTYSNDVGHSLLQPNGVSRTIERSAAFNLNLPIFSGGGGIASTTQAQYAYQKALEGVEFNVRQTINNTRQSYLGIIAGISKIEADRQAIKSSRSSLEGMQASYRVGTTTLVDVLNQQQKLLDAERNYSNDRYAFVNNLLALKKAAGTLSIRDVCDINTWLYESFGEADKEMLKIRRKYFESGRLTMYGPKHSITSNIQLVEAIPKAQTHKVHIIAIKNTDREINKSHAMVARTNNTHLIKTKIATATKHTPTTKKLVKMTSHKLASKKIMMAHKHSTHQKIIVGTTKKAVTKHIVATKKNNNVITHPIVGSKNVITPTTTIAAKTNPVSFKHKADHKVKYYAIV